MKYFSSMFFTALVVLSFGFAKDLQLEGKEQTTVRMDGQDYIIQDMPIHQDPNTTREQITLILDDFETTAGDWAPSEGWTTNTTEYHSETTSYHAADYLWCIHSRFESWLWVPAKGIFQAVGLRIPVMASYSNP